MKLDVHDLTFIPVSALLGDNIVDRSANMPWYEGGSLLHHLEEVHIASDRNLIDARFPVQYVIRPQNQTDQPPTTTAATRAGGRRRAQAGRRGRRAARPGFTSTIASIDTADGPVEEAFSPMSVTLRLTDEIDISRGDMIARRKNQPHIGQDIEAMVCWMSESTWLREGAKLAIKHTTRWARAVVKDLQYQLDVNTLHRYEDAVGLALNEIGRVTLRTTLPLFYDEYRRNRATGSFILVDEGTNTTVGAGMILAPPPASERQHHVAPRRGRPGRPPVVGRHRLAHRALGLGQVDRGGRLRGAARRLGPPGLRARRRQRPPRPERRPRLQRRRPRRERAPGRPRGPADGRRRVVALVPLISPYRADRDLVRALHVEAGLPFVEVFVDTPIELCEQRDPKGLYAKARAGEITGFTGIDDPYEAPPAPELVLTRRRRRRRDGRAVSWSCCRPDRSTARVRSGSWRPAGPCRTAPAHRPAVHEPRAWPGPRRGAGGSRSTSRGQGSP